MPMMIVLTADEAEQVRQWEFDVITDPADETRGLLPVETLENTAHHSTHIDWLRTKPQEDVTLTPPARTGTKGGARATDEDDDDDRHTKDDDRHNRRGKHKDIV